ncbi:MAG: GDYXXLXY domain-containing protein [Kiritimatiellia bacterium]
MKKSIILACFVVLCLAQLFVPASMIHKREATLRHGEVFNFKTAPVDPYDAFRGRYVALNYEQSTVNGNWSARDYRRGRVVYAILDRDADGFAQITDVVLERPADQAFISARVGWAGSNRLMLRLPFDRFYMDEFDAPVAERAFIWQRDREQRTAYARTRIRDGFGVIEDLIVEEMPMRDWLMTRENTQP